MPKQRVHLVFNDTSNDLTIQNNTIGLIHIYKKPILLLEISIYNINKTCSNYFRNSVYTVHIQYNDLFSSCSCTMLVSVPNTNLKWLHSLTIWRI